MVTAAMKFKDAYSLEGELPVIVTLIPLAGMWLHAVWLEGWGIQPNHVSGRLGGRAQRLRCPIFAFPEILAQDIGCGGSVAQQASVHHLSVSHLSPLPGWNVFAAHGREVPRSRIIYVSMSS